MPEDRSKGLWRATGQQDWIRLRTLIYLRWIAVFGQSAAVIAAWLLYDIALDLPMCFMAIGASVAVNLTAIIAFPATRRLSEAEMTLTLLFDTAQLSVLLALTGGLNNPFAFLILVPVTIAATALDTRPTVLIGISTISMISLVAGLHLPLITHSGTVVRVPDEIEFGFWVAIMTGVVFLGAYAHRIALEIRAMAEALVATQMALSREQKLTDLSGVVAAAAHELGTPLATIKLVSSELADELADDPELRDDALLIRDQANRCRDILRSMGRSGKDDMQMRTAPLVTVLREAAEPHSDRGKELIFDLAPGPGGQERQPVVHRSPELIHALRNLIQNAVDFARSTVWIEGEWTDREVFVRIIDDGRGFPPGVLARIGDPYLHTRDPDRSQRPEYEGMGLGLFIAKTLLERTGARLRFCNVSAPPPAEGGPRQSGAEVELRWPIEHLSVAQGPLGENRQIVD
ncbi:sensor histidine kinase RegB [Paenirhodobacter enshiensis]|uniref:sensor histidine kinase RegB n=1 Tax=Paenirhodobacter enshiensis TaxID=1105367 RepID=UPI0035AD9FC0